MEALRSSSALDPVPVPRPPGPEATTLPVRSVELSGHSDARGHLTVVEGLVDVPFEIRRVYYLFGVPGDADRGGHAHKDLQQLVVAVSGSFTLLLDDGRRRTAVRLSDPNRGVLVGPMLWRELVDFSEGAVCLVLASAPYDELDYVRDRADFLAMRGRGH